MNIEKLGDLFESKYQAIAERRWNQKRPPDWSEGFEREVEEAWVEYLNRLDCTVIGRDEILEDFEHIVNHSARGRVCVTVDENHILVPVSVAERALALGFLPESS
jgi:hypothetical protein